MYESKYSIEEKDAFINEWNASGLTAKEYCNRKGISASTFNGWRRRMHPETNRKETQKTGMVRIQPSSKSGEMVLEYCGARIRFCRSALKEVMQVLKVVNG